MKILKKIWHFLDTPASLDLLDDYPNIQMFIRFTILLGFLLMIIYIADLMQRLTPQ